LSSNRGHAGGNTTFAAEAEGHCRLSGRYGIVPVTVDSVAVMSISRPNTGPGGTDRCSHLPRLAAKGHGRHRSCRGVRRSHYPAISRLLSRLPKKMSVEISSVRLQPV
jgi:hypothetical protein